MAYSLGSVDLGTVVDEFPKTISENIIILVLPTFDTSYTQVFDGGGAAFYTDIKGTLTATTVDGLKTKVMAILALNTGNQQSTLAFSSDVTGDRNVKVLSADGHYRKGVPLEFEYTIKLVEASTDV